MKRLKQFLVGIALSLTLFPLLGNNVHASVSNGTATEIELGTVIPWNALNEIYWEGDERRNSSSHDAHSWTYTNPNAQIGTNEWGQPIYGPVDMHYSCGGGSCVTPYVSSSLLLKQIGDDGEYTGRQVIVDKYNVLNSSSETGTITELIKSKGDDYAQGKYEVQYKANSETYSLSEGCKTTSLTATSAAPSKVVWYSTKPVFSGDLASGNLTRPCAYIVFV